MAKRILKLYIITINVCDLIMDTQSLGDIQRFKQKHTGGYVCEPLTILDVYGLWIVDSQRPRLSSQLLGVPCGGSEYWGSR